MSCHSKEQLHDPTSKLLEHGAVPTRGLLLKKGKEFCEKRLFGFSSHVGTLTYSWISLQNWKFSEADIEERSLHVINLNKLAGRRSLPWIFVMALDYKDPGFLSSSLQQLCVKRNRDQMASLKYMKKQSNGTYSLPTVTLFYTKPLKKNNDITYIVDAKKKILQHLGCVFPKSGTTKTWDFCFP